MEEFHSFDEIMDYAIDREIESYKFYVDLAKRTKNSIMRNVFESFAMEELSYQAKLKAMKKSQKFKPAEKIGNLKIADYFVDVKSDSDSCYKEMFVLAAKKEAAAARLYTDLSSIVKGKDQKDIFLLLALEETRHKLYFETAYDDITLKDNFENL